MVLGREEAAGGRLPGNAADKEVIDVERRRPAAWAQLERHCGIAVMTHYRACRTPDLSRSGPRPLAPVPDSLSPGC